MEQRNIPRIMIAATGSGSGKTTVTCGLLQAFLKRGKKLSSFKCGPDYIDPMFHSQVLGIQSRNLDLFFTEENTTKYLLAKSAKASDLAIIEGVMGFYDGLGGISTSCSSYDLARKTKTPVILVVDCKGMSVSILAVIKGFLEMRKDSMVRGVILNRISPMIYSEVKELIEKELAVEVLGYLPRMLHCQLESRHLGLIPAKEIENIKEIIQSIGEQIEDSIDLDRILEIGEQAESVEYQLTEELRNINSEYGTAHGKPSEQSNTGKKSGRIRIAIAKDQAFCFYYQDNLDLLEELGAELIPFSPMVDKTLPSDIHGLILGGGYPELYLNQLSKNKTMLRQIKELITEGTPCLAECGGFMYLQQRLKDKNHISYEMVGAIEGESFPTDKLTRFGYISLRAKEDNILCKKGIELRGHEFHYWDSTNTGNSFHAQKPLRKANWDCVVTRKNLWAGYPHIHFYSNVQVAIEFIKNCQTECK